MGSREPSIERESDRESRLASAREELDAVLEATDLESEPALADALVEAVAATHRATELATEGADAGAADE